VRITGMNKHTAIVGLNHPWETRSAGVGAVLASTAGVSAGLPAHEIRSCTSMEIRVETRADGATTISGYAAVFDSPSQDMGGWTEIIKPGAFTRTLKENPDILLLRDHNWTQILGRTGAKTLELGEDGKGLWYRAEIPDLSYARDLIVSIKRGDIRGGSCGFNTADEGDKITRVDDKIVRELLDVDLYECTITGNPAYLGTSAQVRSSPGLVARIQSAQSTPEIDKRRRLLKRADIAL
jgi:HK97 family phage prohead protease